MAYFFLNSSAADRLNAATEVSHLLRAHFLMFKNSNPDIFATVEEVAAAIVEKAVHWSFEDEIQHSHSQGRELARRYYEQSAFEETSKRFGHDCSLKFEYTSAKRSSAAEARESIYFHRDAPIAFLPHSDEILVRFGFDSDFSLFAAYPFLFLHEYMSHVYATDHGNELFNDGWLLYAANAFLKRQTLGLNMFSVMDQFQVDVFEMEIYPNINPKPREIYAFCRALEPAMESLCPGRFDEYTYELAAFQPQPGEHAFWPTKLINEVRHQWEQNPYQLLNMVELAPSVRQLAVLISAV